MRKAPLKRSGPEPKERKEAKKQCRSIERCEAVSYFEQCEVFGAIGRKLPVKHPHKYHAAHIFGTRSYPNIAADQRNLICLCEECHVWFHNNTSVWPKFVDWLRGDGYYDALKLESNTTGRGYDSV